MHIMMKMQQGLKGVLEMKDEATPVSSAHETINISDISVAVLYFFNNLLEENHS